MYNLNRNSYGRDNMHSEPSNSWQLQNNQARRLPRYDFHDLTFTSDRFNRNYIDNGEMIYLSYIQHIRLHSNTKHIFSDIQRNRAYKNRDNY